MDRGGMLYVLPEEDVTILLNHSFHLYYGYDYEYLYNARRWWWCSPTVLGTLRLDQNEKEKKGECSQEFFFYFFRSTHLILILSFLFWGCQICINMDTRINAYSHKGGGRPLSYAIQVQRQICSTSYLHPLIKGLPSFLAIYVYST